MSRLRPQHSAATAALVAALFAQASCARGCHPTAELQTDASTGSAPTAPRTVTAPSATEAVLDGPARLRAIRAYKVPECPEGMAYVPGGSFAMGGSASFEINDAGQFQNPTDDAGLHYRAGVTRATRVTLKGFCIDRTAVTSSEYEACVKAHHCPARDLSPTVCIGVAPKHIDDHPVTCVRRNAHAQAYCANRHARLPTSAEWEFAAHGATPSRWTFGNDSAAPGIARCADLPHVSPTVRRDTREEGGPGTPRVKDGTLSDTCAVGVPGWKSPFDVLDLGGNAQELTSSCEHDDCKPHGEYAVAPNAIARGGSSLEQSHISDYDEISFEWNDSNDRIVDTTPFEGLSFRCAVSADAKGGT